ncbi:MAG: tRNA preQ1(34) S-adenosylmethionine ribosyltransferase-isomerase QueA [Clostridia bacterium]|nr:tRNA preQ1(34) S-adenosylmethionine ribosyltransferase-isomerase QueA [Clostridia bacterium]
MKKSDFFYDLPEELIAQSPIEPRDSSRLLVLGKTDGRIEHRIFKDIKKYFKPGDCLILNNTKVLPARIYGTRSDTGAVVEFLLLKRQSEYIWEVIAGPGKKAREGHKFTFGDGLMKAEVTDVLSDGNRIVNFKCESNFYETLDKIGEMPLPHYIKQKLDNPERYQTVYAEINGSAAAPTAGLHFTPELLDEIRKIGVKVAFVTLHVGLGTFRPVKAENIEEHHMHSEHYSLPEETAKIINETKNNGGMVFAVGTTCTRTLESVATKYGEIKADEGDTDIFIYPGYDFKCVDSLITNFHLPESTLIMLVSAFCGYDNIMSAYRIAVEEKYRFFSFGDAMCITDRI